MVKYYFKYKKKKMKHGKINNSEIKRNLKRNKY